MELDRQAQMDLLLEHYDHPCCHGKMAEADVVQKGNQPGCGDVVTIYLKVERPAAAGPEGNRPERIEKVSFLASGCVISQAAASMLMEIVREERPSLDTVLAMDHEEMFDLLGRDVVVTRPGCATLALSTLKAAIRQYRQQN